MLAPTGRTAEPTTAPPDRLTPTLVGSAVVAALGGFLFGYDTAVISGAERAIQSVYRLGDFAQGFTLAIALFGTVAGSALASWPADRFGRRPTLVGLAVLYLVGSIGSALAWDWYSFLAFRALGGVAVGGASVVSPLYIAEIAPAAYRGRLVGVQQFNIVLGIVASYAVNLLIARLGLGATEWRWMLGVQAAPSALFFALLFSTPESPRWLVARGRSDQAARVLTRLGADPAGVDREVAEIRRSLDEDAAVGSDSLFRRAYRTPILLAFAIAMFNQLSGINALMYYAPRIFEMAGAGKDAALAQAVAVGGTNLLFTMLALSVIDRLGRRSLMIAGSIGYIASLSATAWAFSAYRSGFTPTGKVVVLASLLVFIASHAFGQGAVIWVFIGEVFPNRVRAAGQSFGCSTHWVMAALITLTFPVIAEASGALVFAFYAAMMVLQLAWVLLAMPETKGIPLEEIRRRLGME